MDKISGFSDDELLVKILAYLPTKVAVSTSILSKQWRFLWMRVPKLEYNDDSIYYETRYKGATRNVSLLPKSQRIRCFIDRNLPLHRSRVIESLRLRFFTAPFKPEDITSWVALAVSRSVRELSVEFSFRFISEAINALLPSSLYTCKSLVTLKLQGRVLVDVPHVVCFPSLKTLHLGRLKYADEESLQRLLSSSSVLEDLVVQQYYGDNYFKARDYSTNSSSCLIANMPKLEEADIIVIGFCNMKKLLEPVTSVKRLSLHILANRGEVVYGSDMDIVFNELEHLKLSIFKTYWSKLLFTLIKGSPKLRDLKFIEHYISDGMDTMGFWKQMISVPQCLLSSLQTFEWSGHIGVEGRDLATYILRNSCRLKIAKIFLTNSLLDPQKKLEMIKELEVCSRGSTICNLLFV